MVIERLAVQDIFVHPSGQDDNLGDSALRRELLGALRERGNRLHVYVGGQSSDYLAGLPLVGQDSLYPTRTAWRAALRRVERPVYVLNAGEINPHPGHVFPDLRRRSEVHGVTRRGGMVIAAGLGLKDPVAAKQATFDSGMTEAAVMSWRDQGSREAAGFGAVAPDWAFALGLHCSDWASRAERRTIAVTLRFDRPWPGAEWCASVRRFAEQTQTRVVTVAQVARDAPRAVQLAEALSGEYLVAPSTRHDDLDRHVRTVYGTALAVVSDRAHALIIGATEGAYPIGTASDPQKIRRILDTADLGGLTGDHDHFASRVAGLETALPGLARAVTTARRDVQALSDRVQEAIAGAA